MFSFSLFCLSLYMTEFALSPELFSFSFVSLYYVPYFFNFLSNTPLSSLIHKRIQLFPFSFARKQQLIAKKTTVPSVPPPFFCLGGACFCVFLLLLTFRIFYFLTPLSNSTSPVCWLCSEKILVISTSS